MPRPWFSKSGLSLWASTVVPSRVMAAVPRRSTSPPPLVVFTAAVPSPASGAVTKRDT